MSEAIEPALGELQAAQIAALRLILEAESFTLLEVYSEAGVEAEEGPEEEREELVEAYAAFRVAFDNYLALAEQHEHAAGEPGHTEHEITTLQTRVQEFDESVNAFIEFIPQSEGRGKELFEKVERLETDAEDMLVTLDAAIATELTALRQANALTQSRVTRAFMVNVTALAICLAIVLLLHLLIKRSIVTPLMALTRQAREFGRGNLEMRLETRSRDEVGALAHEFNQMADSLQESTVSKAYVDSVLNSLSEILLVLDLDGNIVQANPAAFALLQCPESELLGQSVTRIVRGETVLMALKQLPTEPELVILAQEVELLAYGGQHPILATLSAALMHDRDGNLQGIVCLAQDISERKAAEIALRESEANYRHQTEELRELLQKLQRTQAQLVQSEKMSSLGQLVAGVAHEINNPVSFIHGNIQHAENYANELLELVQLHQRQDAEAQARLSEVRAGLDLDFMARDLPQLFGSMRMGTSRIREIVRALRNFSRLDEAEFKDIDIHTGIDSTLQILAHRLRSQDSHPAILVVKDYEPLPAIECLAGQLNQVFMNLIANAIDALETVEYRGKITIQTSLLPESDQVRIVIADNGPGIDALSQARIFDPFYTTKPVGKGTGLGLAISYQIVVERHGGSLRCQSSPGQGTRFTIDLPLIPAVHAVA
ncbi:MAG: HAMP domain-containing protein [Spirulinaceae cyanobacterium SM2_1_0]|nr:HAMP domain-containing protein [Spirulinaceae cyanobacterium SM2_1_0]